MSSQQAKLYHSITIGNKNTWDDWHIVPTSRPKVNVPPVKTSYVDIPAGDGVLDLSTSLTDRITFGNRQGSWEFLVINGYGEWQERYSELLSYLHGRSYKVILDDDPQYYYEGRMAVNEWRSEAHWSTVVFDYNFGPYKFPIDTTIDWMWDRFDFTTMYMTGSYEIPVNSQITLTVYGHSASFVPVITASEDGMSMYYKGKTFTFKKGVNINEDISFNNGPNEITLYGQGFITIENTGGRL